MPPNAKKSSLESVVLWLGLLSEAVLPLFFLHAWLAPGLQSDDRLISLIIVLAGENLVLFFMMILSPMAEWKFREWSGVLGFFGLIALVGSAAHSGGYVEAATASLLLLVRFASVAIGRKPKGDEFPARPSQAFMALGIFWGLLIVLEFFNQIGVPLSSSRGVGEMAAHGTVYFFIVLAIRLVRLRNSVAVPLRQPEK